MHRSNDVRNGRMESRARNAESNAEKHQLLEVFELGMRLVSWIMGKNSSNINPVFMPCPGMFCWRKAMVVPKPVRAPTLLIALLAGVAIAFSAALLLKMWLPRLAPLLFIAVCATWLYAGWCVTFIPRHRP